MRQGEIFSWVIGMLRIKNQGLSLLKPYKAKPVAIYDKTWERMDRNESGFGVAPMAEEAIKEQLTDLSRYPENSGYSLREVLAAAYGLEPDQIIVGNGSYELLWLIASVFLDEKSESIITAPTFIWYKTYSTLLGGTVKEVPLKDLKVDLTAVQAAVSPATRLIWLCNPNNPTGEYIPEKAMDEFLNSVDKDIAVVIDEAYLEFIDGYTPSMTIDLLTKHPNVIILRTFSKFYGLASLRIGYALADKEVINALYQFRIPPNHSRIAEAAARGSVLDRDFQEGVRAAVRSERDYLYGALTEAGVEFVPTQTNFMLVKLGQGKVGPFLAALKKEKVLAKDGLEFGLPDYVRLTIKSHKANERFIGYLKVFLTEEKTK